MSAPTTALLMAQALAAENQVMTPPRTGSEMRAHWRRLPEATRHHYMRKAKRVLWNLQELGPVNG